MGVLGLFANSEPTTLSKNPGEEGRSLVATLGPSALEANAPLAAFVRVPFFPAAVCRATSVRGLIATTSTDHQIR